MSADGELHYEKRHLVDWVDDDDPRRRCRFAKLPHITGQKYTIGRYFTSKEEQGELIWCDKMGVANNLAGHCEITCCAAEDGGGFAIRPLGNSPVIVNASGRLHPGQTQELRFGDKITLFPTLVFYFERAQYAQEVTISVVDVDEVDTNAGVAVDSPLDNPYLLRHILDFLPVPELKSARLVSSLWNDEVTPLLRTRAWTSLYLGWNSLTLGMQSCFLLRQQMAQFRPTSLALIMSESSYSLNMEEDRHALSAKRHSDVDCFFLQNPNFLRDFPLTALDLIISLRSAGDISAFLKILETTSPILKKLGIALDARSDCALTDVDLERFRSLAFPSMKRLQCEWRFNLEHTNGDVATTRRREKWKNVFVTLVKAQKGMESFKITLNYPEDSDICGECLESLHIPALKDVVLDGTSIWDCLTGRMLLQDGLQPNQLSSLELCFHKLEGDEDASVVSKVLQKQSNSLKKLKLTLPRRPAPNTVIEMPRMGKLQVLEIYGVAVEEEDEREPVGGVTFPDCPEGKLVYATNFPSLEALTVQPFSRRVCDMLSRFPVWRRRHYQVAPVPAWILQDHWLQFGYFMKPFLDLEEDQPPPPPCPRVVRLDVPYFWRSHLIGEVKLTTGVDLDKLQGVFPNVKIPEIDNATAGVLKKSFGSLPFGVVNS